VGISLKVLAGVVCVFTQLSCMELVRRPDPGTVGRWRGTWADSTDSVGRDPEEERAGERGTTLRAAGSKTRAGEGTSPAGKRSTDQRARVRAVNEYALWCIGQSMWNEARSHLEQALKQDSLAASLYNNLAIVHEHLGHADSAAAYYQRALRLNGRNAAFQRNLTRLRRQRKAASDTVRTIDLFELKKRVPGPGKAPY